MLTVKELETNMILGLIVAAVVTLFAYYPVPTIAGGIILLIREQWRLESHGRDT